MTKEEFYEKYIKDGKFVRCEEKEKRHVRHPEHDLQVQCVRYFRLKYPKLLIYANANGGYRTKSEAKSLVAEGVVSGVPDLFIPIAREGFNGLYIEMKDGMKGVVSKNQEKVIDYLRKEGYKCEIVRFFEQFRIVVDCYINSETDKD